MPQVCGSKDASSDEADAPASPPSSSGPVMKTEPEVSAVCWPQPPVMTIPPHVIAELMGSVDLPPPPPPPPLSSANGQLKSPGTLFRPIEPNVSVQSAPPSLKPMPLLRTSGDIKTPIVSRAPSSVMPTMPLLHNHSGQSQDIGRSNVIPRILLPSHHPLNNLKKS